MSVDLWPAVPWSAGCQPAVWDHGDVRESKDEGLPLAGWKPALPGDGRIIDRNVTDVQRAHGHAVVNQVIIACELTRRFGIRKVWPEQPMNTTKMVRATISCFDDFQRAPSPVTLRALVECGIYWSCDSAINKATTPILEKIYQMDGMSENEIIAEYEAIPHGLYEGILESMRFEIEHLRSALIKDRRS